MTEKDRGYTEATCNHDERRWIHIACNAGGLSGRAKLAWTRLDFGRALRSERKQQLQKPRKKR